MTDVEGVTAVEGMTFVASMVKITSTEHETFKETKVLYGIMLKI